MRRVGLLCCVVMCCISVANTTSGQTFGIEPHNTLMPASGVMGGVSIAPLRI